MNEQRARRVTAERAAGRCEITGRPGPTDMSHRVARSQGGLWQPSNLLHVSRDAHAWLEANPRAAEAGGWHVPRGVDPAGVPVYLRNPFPWWFLLSDDGVYHLVHPEDHGLPAIPDMPAGWAA